MCHQSLPCGARPGGRAGHCRDGRNPGSHAAETALKSGHTGTRSTPDPPRPLSPATPGTTRGTASPAGTAPRQPLLELRSRGRRRRPAGQRAAAAGTGCAIRRPRAGYESRVVALDRGEPGALLVAAGPGPPAGPAPISLLALNGPRIPEAAGADIEHPGLERGHRTLTITRTGGKVAAIPPAP